MPQYRIQVSNSSPDSPARDAIVNTIYVDTDAEFAVSGVDADGLLNDVLNIWDNRLRGLGEWKAKLYKMSDPEPRFPIATKIKTVTPATALGPREVALCLSFYSERNTPRRRGRLYLGPWPSGALNERPTDTLCDGLLSMAQDLGALGGINMQWVIFSPTSGEYHNVSDCWVDNEWDTVRSRGVRATSRRRRAVEG